MFGKSKFTVAAEQTSATTYDDLRVCSLTLDGAENVEHVDGVSKCLAILTRRATKPVVFIVVSVVVVVIVCISVSLLLRLRAGLIVLLLLIGPVSSSFLLVRRPPLQSHDVLQVGVGFPVLCGLKTVVASPTCCSDYTFNHDSLTTPLPLRQL